MNPTTLRRLLHAASAAMLVLLLLSPETLRGGALALVLAAGFLELLRLNVPGVHERLAARVPAFRPEEKSRVSGAGWLALGLGVAAWMPLPGPVVGILAGALADPAAAWAGEHWGPEHWGAGAGKTWIGTAAAAAVVLGAALVAGLSLPAGIVVAAVGAALERWSGPLDDNLVLAPGVAIAAALLA